MALRIIPASEPVVVETTITTVYSPPGVGKTSLAFSSADPLLLDTDRGVHRSGFRKDSVPASTWADISGITADDVEPYKTLVLDTAGRALDLLTADIIRREPKMGNGGALTLKGFGKLKAEFVAYLNLMRSFGLDIILIAHSEEKQQGDDIVDRIDMTGGSKQEVYKVADAMARLSIQGNKRVLTFSPSETRFGKDPAGIGQIEVPDLRREPLFLAGIIQHIKDKLNEASAAEKEAVERTRVWAGRVAEADSAADFTTLIGECNGDKNAKRMLHDAAKNRGFTFDQQSGTYVDPNASNGSAPGKSALEDAKAVYSDALDAAAEHLTKDAAALKEWEKDTMGRPSEEDWSANDFIRAAKLIQEKPPAAVGADDSDVPY